ncbi:tRNA modification GTPase [Nitrobacter sp. Nb-311A]|uniref:tRNA uridine-5-carboxymethylaminomethyl(34) synthesis GTPase MnmE n=1 Tax=unclassified Nitrobacter TaxID=2620411 RepID=UPI0000684B2D|nr:MULTISPECIES: tRNA uridine-5-carboxymethylaminomethyl(34) synthesis GTPase MnmE [unclassified Nitrobacter]EAQ37089.1 tRNA modification GTPase [Nitrobacter sp. Nb-311A]MCB1393523.1 tRNA uridine-5-carboxymethylaminomethyl(34) synthesis GTPase MnmE [Nitrobacter sp.]MCV0386785.1 tRNA uridine-5-carboxymethylaminomethyl(34) synthesis GTPase MnmE [Nitrobacter sp.]
MHPREQTIFALSSGRPPSAIAVVRVSGPQAGAALRELAGAIPVARMARRVLLRDRIGEAIDDAVVLWFPAPASATGEDVAEFHIHGGRAVLNALFAALSSIDNTRAAEPGEFTRRAFENGKIDLTEAEGLDDLIHADTDRQRRQALRQLQGLLGDRARGWRKELIEASALIEAGIDFVDEGDVPEDLLKPAMEKIAQLRREIEQTLAAPAQSERLRDGLMIAITGPPNAGKSTLLNRLVRREAAIVSPHAGTTRDIIEAYLDLDGYPVTLIDTAGIRETDDPVEQEGMRRARDRAASADLVLWLSDGEMADLDPTIRVGDCSLWLVRNKIDLSGPENDEANPRQRETTTARGSRVRRFRVSARRGDGLDDLVAALTVFAGDRLGSSEAGVITRLRQRNILRDAAGSLARAEALAGRGDELIAEELRIAIHLMGRLLGRVDIDDILDSLFKEFCIGK